MVEPAQAGRPSPGVRQPSRRGASLAMLPSHIGSFGPVRRAFASVADEAENASCPSRRTRWCAQPRALMESEPSCPHDEWVRRFAVRFQVLQPIVTEQQSIDVAMAAFPSSNDLEPEDAAAVFG